VLTKVYDTKNLKEPNNQYFFL